MPFNQYPVEIIAANQRQHAFTVEKGDIVGVLFEPEARGTGAAESYAQVYLATTDTPSPTPFVMLCSGYVGANTGITWTGRIHLDPSYAVYVRVWSHQALVFRLSIATEER